LRELIGPFDHDQPYFVNGPDRGYALVYRTEAIWRLDWAKPDELRFPQRGWLRVDTGHAQAWVDGSSARVATGAPLHGSSSETRAGVAGMGGLEASALRGCHTTSAGFDWLKSAAPLEDVNAPERPGWLRP